MDTYGKCIVMSLGMFLTAALIAQYTHSYWDMLHIVSLIVVTFVLGLFVLIRYAPRDTPNRPITSLEEIRKFKLLSIVHLMVWLVVTTILSYFRLNIFVISLCFGVLLELFSITPIGHKFFDIIKYGLGSDKVSFQ